MKKQILQLDLWTNVADNVHGYETKVLIISAYVMYIPWLRVGEFVPSCAKSGWQSTFPKGCDDYRIIVKQSISHATPQNLEKVNHIFPHHSNKTARKVLNICISFMFCNEIQMLAIKNK